MQRSSAANRLNRIDLGGIDYIGCAELLGCLQPLRLEVDNRDPRRAGDACAADRIEPDAPGTENDDSVAGVHVSGIQDGSGAGGNAAAQQRSLRERHIRGHKGELVLVDERAFSEAAKSHALEQCGAVAAQARRIPRPPQRCFRVPTLEGASGLASRARSTRLHKRAHDMIADAELCDIRANLGDDPRDLMAEYCRNDIVRGEQKIGVTQPGCLHLNENFAPNG
jgi:hypothetical protein